MKQGFFSGAVRAFRKRIYRHYEKHGRRLPWRKTRDPYRILVSEVMLQQTQVDRVEGKYREFIEAFPDFRSLARAPLREILRVWSGLGYNRRALALKRTAERVMSEFGGILPSNPDVLRTLPGVGSATACSIAAFAFNRPAAFIETNIRTVFIHFFFSRRRAVRDEEILPLVEKTLDRAHPRRWYSALMDYGAMLKRSEGNPERGSSRRRTQPPFKGSNRQIRGMILRACIERPGMSALEIVRALDAAAARVRGALAELEREGLLKRQGGCYLIP
jgi:A/G-specific adenine glycosylase